jgi:hypothetical protein
MDDSPTTLESLIAQVQSRTRAASALDRVTVAIGVAEHLAQLSDNLVGFFVDEARADGASWTEIGARFGVSRQAVQKRFIPSGEAINAFWSRATSDLREAVMLARQAAQARRGTYTGTEHLLLGLVAEPDGKAARALARCGANPVTVRGAVDGRIGVPKDEPLPDMTPFTQLALRALQHAQREAMLLNQVTVGGEHLALGLITVGEGLAREVLLNLGVSYEKLRAEVIAVITDLSGAAGDAR